MSIQIEPNDDETFYPSLIIIGCFKVTPHHIVDYDHCLLVPFEIKKISINIIINNVLTNPFLLILMIRSL